MKLIEAFNLATSGGWTTAGLDVQFKVVNRVVDIHNANDLVYHIPALIGYDHIGEQVRLPLKWLKKPDSYSWLYWLSGHSAEQYRQAIRRVS